MLEAQPWGGEGVEVLGPSPEPGGLLFLQKWGRVG